MDIAYLLWLQGIREALPPAVEGFFVAISAIAISKVIVVIPCLLFWCVDKRAGKYMLFTFSVGTLLNQFVKNTVCCYRPWIRSQQILPAQAALAEATGYSFPSGHTQAATNVFGALGWQYRKRLPWLLWLCAAFVLLVGFSRNFLGVHTPQDVAVGLLEGVLVLWATERLIDWAEAQPGRDARVLVGALVLGACYVAYIALKPYPMDYDAADALVVDPLEMQVDCFKSGGVFLGAVVGWFLERRYLAFEVDPAAAGWKRMAVRLVLGMAVVALCHVAATPLSLAGVDERVYELVKNFLTVFGAVYVAPLAFTAVEKRLY